jgi:hypothetical protein
VVLIRDVTLGGWWRRRLRHIRRIAQVILRDVVGAFDSLDGVVGVSDDEVESVDRAGVRLRTPLATDKRVAWRAYLLQFDVRAEINKRDDIKC